MSDVGMSDLEGQLRTFMNIAAGEPPHRVDAETVRRQAVRRRSATLLAGVTATVLVLCIGAVVAVAATGSAPGPASHAGPPAEVPRFYIEQGVDGALFTKTLVRATASGAVTDTVACPWRRAHVFITSIVPADDQEFFILCERYLGRDSISVAGSRIYRFRLSSAGRVDGYSLVRGGVLNGLQVGQIGVTPDGSEVAVPVYPPGRTQGSDIIVIDTRTGAHAVWHGVSRVPGKIVYPVLNRGLSFTANGQELEFLTQPQCVQGENAPPCPVTGVEEVREISNPASGGKLSSSRLLLRELFPFVRISNAVISLDGRTLIVAETNVSRRYFSVARVSVATGKQVGVLFRARTVGFAYGVFNSDPSCRFFILVVGPSIGRMVNRGLDNGRILRLKPDGEDVNLEVW
jgi:hypothetical protein